MIDFPASPTVGQQFTAAGVTWVWDGTKWAASGLSVAYLPLAGGTMSGPIVLAADPAANLQAATKQYVDGGRLGDNRIINGDCRIDQRNAGASLANSAGNVFPVDRWIANGSAANAFTVGRNLNAVAGPPGFPYYVGVQSSSAYAIVTNSAFALQHRIEADQVGDLGQGTANAQPFTVSFWVFSSLTGTFSGALDNSNAGTNRNYLFTYSIPVANAWTKIVLAIPGDATGGGWTLTGNLTGLRLLFDLGSGATYRGTAGAWGPASAYPMNGVTGAVSVVAVNGATFYLTGVKLEIGSVATPYNRQSLAKSLADCQRYYSVGALVAGGYNTASGSITATGFYPVSMRATPTLTPTYTALVNVLAANISIGFISPTSFYNQGAGSTVGQISWTNTWAASAEL
jgi:hypothetical protein